MLHENVKLIFNVEVISAIWWTSTIDYWAWLVVSRDVIDGQFDLKDFITIAIFRDSLFFVIEQVTSTVRYLLGLEIDQLILSEKLELKALDVLITFGIVANDAHGNFLAGQELILINVNGR